MRWDRLEIIFFVFFSEIGNEENVCYVWDMCYEVYLNYVLYFFL